MEFNGVNLLPEQYYKPYDVCCHSIPNHQGRKNMYSTSCAAKLAMEEPHLECLKCKGLYGGPKKKLTEEERLRKNAQNRGYKKKMRGELKEWTCATCGVTVPKRFKYCAEHKVIAERERIIREREKKRAKALKRKCLD